MNKADHPDQSEIWQHVKSQGLYTVIGEGLQESDLEPVVIYRSLFDGELWVRPTSEFYDGRFRNIAIDELITPPETGE